MDIDQLDPIESSREHTNSVDAVCIDPNGKKKFATGSHDRTIKIWDLKTFKCINTSEADR